MDAGEYVIDGDDEDPDLAVVLRRTEAPIDEWTIDPPGGEQRTVAADNPEYSPDEPVVVVAFVESGLERHWPEWTEADPADLYERARESEMRLYYFPESRLRTLDDDELAAVSLDEGGAVAMDDLRARLEDAGWQTEAVGGVLELEKLGEQYRIHPTGEVKGEGRVREPLENIVAEYVDG
ncbi:MAG: hypothetical protein ABEH56_06470 [Salinirussus sp.]